MIAWRAKGCESKERRESEERESGTILHSVTIICADVC